MLYVVWYLVTGRGVSGTSEKRGAAIGPSPRDVLAPQFVEVPQTASAELDVAGDLGFLSGERPCEVVGGDGLVDRIGLDVLVVEVRCVPAESELPQSVAVLAIRFS